MTTYSWTTGALPANSGTVSSDPTFGIIATPAIRVSGSAGASFVYFPIDASKKASARFYFRTPSAWPSSSCNIASMKPDNSNLIFQAAIAGAGAPGQARLIHPGAGTVAQSPTGTLELDTSYRFEISYDGILGVARVSVFPLGSDDELWSGSFTDPATLTVDVVRLDFGRINSTPTFPSDLFYDSILIDNTRAETLGRVTEDTLSTPPTPEEPEEPSDPGAWTSGPLPEVSGTVISDPSYGIPSAPSLRASGSGAASFAIFAIPSARKVAARFYFRTPTAWPSASCNIASIKPNGSAVVFQATMAGSGAPGQFRMTSTAGTLHQSSAGLMSLDSEYRVEMHYDADVSSGGISLFALGSDTPLWSAASSSLGTTASATRFDVGRINSSPSLAGDFSFDAIQTATGSTALIGRALGDDLETLPPEPSGLPKYWDSASDTDPPTQGSDISFIASHVPNYIRVQQAAGQMANLQWSFSPETTRLGARTYFRQTAHAGASWALITLRNGMSDPVATLTLSGSGQPGQARLTTGSTTIVQSANNTLALNRWYRAELQLDRTTGQARAAVFAWGDVIPTWTSGWLSHANFSGVVSNVNFGRTTTTPQVPEFMLKSLVATSGVSNWVGPAAQRSVVTKIWDGSEARPAQLVGIWNGSSVRPARIL